MDTQPEKEQAEGDDEAPAQVPWPVLVVVEEATRSDGRVAEQRGGVLLLRQLLRQLLRLGNRRAVGQPNHAEAASRAEQGTRCELYAQLDADS